MTEQQSPPSPTQDHQNIDRSRKFKRGDWIMLGLSLAGYVLVYLSLVWASSALLVVGLALSLSAAGANIWFLVRSANTSDFHSEEVDALIAGDPIQTITIRILRRIKQRRVNPAKPPARKSEPKA